MCKFQEHLNFRRQRRTDRRMGGKTDPNLQETSSHGWVPIKHLPTFVKE